MTKKALLLHRILSFAFSLELLRAFILVFIFALSLEPRALSPVYAADKGNPPVAYWRFDEGGGPTAYDDSANNYDGTLYNHTKFVPGKIGKALSFDGTDDYVTVGNVPGTLTEGTIEMWFKRNTSKPTYQMLFTDGGSQFEICYSSDNLYFYVDNSPIGTGSANNNGVWQHVAGTFSQTGNYRRLYLNGVQVASDVYTGDATVAARYFGSRAGGYPFDGLIDDARIYNYARTADQIKVDYNAGVAANLGSPSASMNDPWEGNSPVGYWSFDENTGTTTYDRSGNGNNSTSFTGASTWVQGRYGSGLSFSGSGNYVSYPAVGVGGTTGTASIWLNFPANYSANTAIANVGAFFIGSCAPGRLNFDVNRGGGWVDGNWGNSTAFYVDEVPANTWLHLAVTWDAGAAKVYINGVLKLTKAYSSGSLTSTGGNWIGHWQNGNDYNGKVDEFKIYDYTRTQAQVAYDYNRGAPVAQYRFDEGGGTVAHNDYSMPLIMPHRYWRFVQTAILTSHAPRTCELRWTDILGNTRTPDSYVHGGTFQDESLWNASFDGQTNTSDQGWISGDTGYITADFGASGCAMMKFEAYTSYTGSARGAAWEIQYSDNNSNWAAVKSWNFQTTDNGGGLGSGNYAGWYGVAWHTHGVLVGDTKFVDGKIGKALQFDGTGDYVEIADQPSLRVANVTLEAWVKFTSGFGNDLIVSKQVGTSTNNSYALWLDGGSLLGMVGDSTGNGTQLSYTWSPTVNQWYHLAYSFDDASDTQKLFIDGNQVASGTVTKSIADYNASPVTIGVDFNNDTKGSVWGYMNGLIDDVRIYNYARTAGQIIQDFNSSVAANLGSPSAGTADPWVGAMPVGYWRLDENTGVLTNDASGNGGDGIITGATWTNGKYGSALAFNNGNTNYVTIDARNKGLTGSQTLMAWVKHDTTSPGPHQTAVTTDVGYQYGVALLAYYHTNTVNVWLGNGSTSTMVASGVNVNDNTWHHIAASYDYTTGDVKIYTDGILRTTQNIGQFTVALGSTGRIGTEYHSQGSYPFNGKIDEVKIYAYARTQEQIAWDYNNGKPVANWRFDEATSGAVSTSSGAIKDDSARYNGTASATTFSYAAGKFGGALSFDGNDYVSLGNLGSFTTTGSLSFWMNATEMANYRNPFTTKRQGGNVGIRFEENASGTFGVVIGDDAGTYSAHIYIASGMQTGRWYHVSVVWDTAANNVKGYLDGVQVFNESHTLWPTTLPDLAAGTGFTADAGRQWYGMVDDVRIYNYARTDDQVKQDYLSGAASRLGD